MKENSLSESIPAWTWGRSNEDTTRKEYVRQAEQQHENFCLRLAGLHVDPSCLHLEASQDKLICCDCCGEGVVEIKCMYKHRKVDPWTVTDSTFYLKASQDGSLQLRSKHAYYMYHQIQGQLVQFKQGLCDFVWCMDTSSNAYRAYSPGSIILQLDEAISW